MKIDLVGPRPSGLRHGVQRGRRLPAPSPVTALAHRLPRRGLRAAAGALPPRDRLRRPRAGAVHPRGPRDPGVRPPRGGGRTARADGRHDHLHDDLSDREVFVQTSFREPALSSASQAGLVNNLNDGLAWGLFPVMFAAARPRRRPDRRPRRALPGRLGPRPAGHRRASPTASGRKWMIVGGHVVSRPSALALMAVGGLVRRLGGRGRRCSAPAPRWSTRRCSPPSATSPTRPGAPGPSASTASGATAASPWERSWPGSSPTPGASTPPCWAVAALTAASGLLVAVRMYETRTAPTAGH